MPRTVTLMVEVIGVRDSLNWLEAPTMASTSLFIAAAMSASCAVLMLIYAPPRVSMRQRGKSLELTALH